MAFCCSSKIGKKRLQQTIQDIKLKVARRRTLKMNDDQIFEFTERFESQAVNSQMSLKQYRESLGLIGTDSLSFMADRMFAVMDANNDGCVSRASPRFCLHFMCRFRRSLLMSTCATSISCFTALRRRNASSPLVCSIDVVKATSPSRTSRASSSPSLKCGLLHSAHQVRNSRARL